MNGLAKGAGVAAVLAVAAAAPAAPQPALSTADQLICKQLRTLDGIEGTVGKLLEENKSMQQMIRPLGSRMAEDLDACKKQPRQATCSPDQQAQKRVLIQKLMSQLTELQSTGEALEQRLKEVAEHRRLLTDKLQVKGGCSDER